MNRIAELRKSYNLTQKELAESLGIAQNTLSQYERGVRRPSGRIILKIAKLFGVDPRKVLGIDEKIVNDTSLANVKRIKTLCDESDVNYALQTGWKLLHIGVSASTRGDGSCYSDVVYTLGWYGNIEDADMTSFAEDGDEYYEQYEPSGWDAR